MAVPKRDTFRLVSDYQAVNSQVEQSPGVMPKQENMRELLGAKGFGTPGFAPGVLADAVGSGGARGLHHRHA